MAKKETSALHWIINEAKRLRREYPRRFKTWREYVAQASAIYASKHKGNSPVGKKRKVGAKKVSYKPHKKLHQTGTSNRNNDKKRTAKAPGKRRSASGKTYYENRKNRSDMPGKLTGMSKIDGSAYREMILRHMRDVERARSNAETDILKLKQRLRLVPAKNKMEKKMIRTRISELQKFIGTQKKEMTMLKALYK